MRNLNTILIKDFYQIDVDPPIVISQYDEFAEVIHLFSSSSELRGVFVADHKDQFVGVITRSDLLDWTRVQVGDFFDEGGQTSDKTIRLSNLIHATTVGEIMNPNTVMASVRLENTAKDAMMNMVTHYIVVIPVIDDENKIIGDIKLSELLEASLMDQNSSQ